MMSHISHIFCVQPIKSSIQNRVIRLQRNGDNQLTNIQVHRELFSYINQFNKKPSWVSILLLYDLNTGVFWWQFFEIDYGTYFKSDIETRLSTIGYWEDEDSVYRCYNKMRNFQSYTFWAADKIVKFFVTTRLDYLESQGKYDTFKQAYDTLIGKVKERDTFPEPPKGEIPLWKYLDRHFFNIPNFPLSPIVTRLIKVKRPDEKWMVEIEGTDWREETYVGKAIVTVVLNENYELVDILGEDYLKKKSTD